MLQDLFPGTELPDHQEPQLLAAINDAALAQQLQPVASLSSKCVQLHDTFAVRFGVMLVGSASAGKSVTYRTLCKALNSIADSAGNAQHAPVLTHVLNPKAASLGELYGEYNELTGDWKDGLASSICRGVVADESPARQWVVFDGPVDALWIESMNTVLDDNCTLCLPNGERMKLAAERMHMLFEVADLSAASPATVSRCGMVYIPPGGAVLGVDAQEGAPVVLDPMLESWLEQLPQVLGLALEEPREEDVPPKPKTEPALSREMAKDIDALFREYVPAGLAWLEKHATESVPTTPRQCMLGVCTWLTALLHAQSGWNYLEEYERGNKVAVSCIFAFSFTWGLGGALDDAGRDGWDKLVRSLFDGVANFPAGAGSVYDYCCNPDCNYSFQVRVCSTVQLLI